MTLRRVKGSGSRSIPSARPTARSARRSPPPPLARSPRRSARRAITCSGRGRHGDWRHRASGRSSREERRRLRSRATDDRCVGHARSAHRGDRTAARASRKWSATLAITVNRSDADAASRAWRWLRASPFTPLAAELCSGTLARVLGAGDEEVFLVRLGGNSHLVRAAQQAVAELGDAAEIGVDVWERLRVAEPAGAVVIRLGTVPAERRPVVVRRIERRTTRGWLRTRHTRARHRALRGSRGRDGGGERPPPGYHRGSCSRPGHV